MADVSENVQARPPFLIDPRHADYVLDQTAPLNDLRLSWTKRLVIIILVLVSVSMAIAELTGLADGGNDWIEVQGEVLALAEEDAFADSYRVDFVFEDQAGESYRLSDTVDALTYNRLEVGGAIDLRYPRDEPFEVLVTDPVQEEQARLNTSFFVTLVLLLAVAWTIGTWVLLPEWVNRRLEQRGQLLSGTVTTCWPIKIGRRRGYSIQLGYVFTAPSGKEIRQQVVRVRDDLRGESLPAPGTPLKVLYVQDRLFRLM